MSKTKTVSKKRSNKKSKTISRLSGKKLPKLPRRKSIKSAGATRKLTWLERKHLVDYGVKVAGDHWDDHRIDDSLTYDENKANIAKIYNAPDEDLMAEYELDYNPKTKQYQAKELSTRKRNKLARKLQKEALEQMNKFHLARSNRAITIDERQDAEKQLDFASKELKGYPFDEKAVKLVNQWYSNTNRIDVVGVDGKLDIEDVERDRNDRLVESKIKRELKTEQRGFSDALQSMSDGEIIDLIKEYRGEISSYSGKATIPRSRYNALSSREKKQFDAIKIEHDERLEVL